MSILVSRELGSKGARIFRNSEEPNEILVLVEWGSLSRAREFMKWGNPSEIRAKAGLIGTPEVYLLEEIDSTGA